jgi:hypothetical protein
MPNHVECRLRIHGKKSQIHNFFLTVEGPEQLIEADKIIPYPQKYKDQDEKAKKHNQLVDKTGKGRRIPDGYNSGGYEWCIKNWGTKWGMYDFDQVQYFTKSAVVNFQTAWSPPIPLITKLGEMFPELKFTLRYWEGGMGFQGVYQVQGSNVLLEADQAYRGRKGG